MDKDQIKGRIKEAQGKVKEVIGKILDDKKMEVEGILQKKAGGMSAPTIFLQGKKLLFWRFLALIHPLAQISICLDMMPNIRNSLFRASMKCIA